MSISITADLVRAGRACLAGAALLALSPSLAEAEVVGGDCVTRKTAFKIKTTSDTNTAGEWVKVPGTQVPFIQGGSGPGCVIVQFSGVADTAHTMVIRARIGGKVANPYLIGFTRKDAGRSAHAFNFVFPNIKPGKRRVVLEWHTFYGFAVSMHQRTTIVQHR